MKKGFTLVELLVTIAIVAILGTIVVISLSGVCKSGKCENRNNNVPYGVRTYSDTQGN